MPPCPGKKLPKSFTPKFLLIVEADKSPMMESVANTGEMMATITKLNITGL